MLSSGTAQPIRGTDCKLSILATRRKAEGRSNSGNFHAAPKCFLQPVCQSPDGSVKTGLFATSCCLSCPQIVPVWNCRQRVCKACPAGRFRKHLRNFPKINARKQTPSALAFVSLVRLTRSVQISSTKQSVGTDIWNLVNRPCCPVGVSGSHFPRRVV